MYQWYTRILYFATVLALCVVVFGAYVRLTDAGLGCPDWPGCYGSLVVPEPGGAGAEFERPLEPQKAWNEMIHRYLASTLGLSIVLVALLAWLNRRDPDQPVALPLTLLGIVIFQGLLGMWTVTLLLKPLIVMAHLIGGLTTLSIAFWLVLEHRRRADIARIPRRHVAALPAVALVVLICQIALGGWTSANYAALACPDLPTCQGQWWPDEANFAEGFVLWRGLGVNYEFGVLDAPSRVAIHFVHRLGALTAFLVIGFTGLRFARRASSPVLRQAGMFALAALCAQVLIGVGIVWFGLPLALASAHNGVAALLLLSVINLNHAAAIHTEPVYAPQPA